MPGKVGLKACRDDGGRWGAQPARALKALKDFTRVTLDPGDYRLFAGGVPDALLETQFAR